MKMVHVASLILSMALAVESSAETATSALTCHWIGAVKDANGNYACWTNPANWAEGVVPGRYVTQIKSDGNLPDSAYTEFQGCGGCVAVFDRPCDFATVSLHGLVSISNIIVSGSAVPKITFGHMATDDPGLNIEYGGGVYVAADAANAPMIWPQIRTFYNGDPKSGTVLYMSNDSADQLSWGAYGGPNPVLGSWIGHLKVQMRGKGDITKVGKVYYRNFQPLLTLNMDGGRFIGDCKQGDYYFYLDIPENTAKAQEIMINGGKYISLGSENPVIRAQSDLSMGGEGALQLSSAPTNAIGCGNGKRLSIACEIRQNVSGEALEVGWNNWQYTFKGTVALSGANTFVCPVIVRHGAVLELASFGTVGNPGPLGKTAGFSVKEESTVRYIGGGESVGHTVNMEGAGTLVNDGGELVLAGGGSGTGTLTLAGRGDIVVASSFACPLSLARNLKVKVGDGQTVELNAVSANGFVIDVERTGSGRFRISSLPAGSRVDFVRINGAVSYIGDDGCISSVNELAPDFSIDALGGKIPDAEGAVVSIDSAEGESGSTVTLGAGDTSVFALRQNQSAVDAVVTIGEGERLAADVVAVSENAANLSINGAAGSTLEGNSAEGVVIETALSREVALEGDITVPLASLRGGGSVRLGENASVKIIRAEDPASSVSLRSESGKTAALDYVETVKGSSLNIAEGAFLQRGVSESTLAESVSDPCIVVGSGDAGRLRFEGGAFTGRVVVAKGDKTKSRGAIYQSGGEIVNITPKGESGSQTLGAAGHGYMELTGGRYVAAGWWYVGSSGYGIMAVHGGTVEQLADVAGSISIGAWEGTGVVDVHSGGKLLHAGKDIFMPYWSRYDANSVLNVGEDALVEAGSVFLAPCNEPANAYRHAVVNLNGGVLVANTVCRHEKYITMPEGISSDATFTCKAYVNFNGGTLRKSYGDYTQLLGATTGWARPPHRITVYERGAVIDTNGMETELGSGAALTAPTGKGVISIPLPSPIAGLVGSPYVEITGDGTAATAYAEFDSASGTVTGIRVTSPGNDYTVATAKLKYGTETIATLDCVLGECASGGLVKTGRGTLKLRVAGTYTGDTVVKAGTLQLFADNIISSKSKLVLDGGTVDLNGMEQVFAGLEVTANGGAVANGTLTLNALKLDAVEALAGDRLEYAGEVAFAEGAELTICNLDALPEKPAKNSYVLAVFAGGINWEGFALSPETLELLPKRWEVKCSGGQIRLCYKSGMMLMVR